MPFTLHPQVHDHGVEFSLWEKPLLGKARGVPPEQWGTLKTATPHDAALAHLLAALQEDDPALASRGHDGVLLPHPRVAALEEPLARSLGLPPATMLVLQLRGDGNMAQPQFALHGAWLEPTGAPAPTARRQGAILRSGGTPSRLPRALFDLVEAVEAFNAADTRDDAARFRRLAVLTAALPDEAANQVRRDNYLETLHVHHATGFSLSLRGEKDGFDFDPVLFGARVNIQDEEEPAEGKGMVMERDALLPPALQELFAQDRFRRDARARDRYVLRDNQYLYVEPLLREALQVVRDRQAMDAASRREFALHPQRVLKEALGERYTELELETVFLPTEEYSDRVVGLGLWEPVVLPWLTREPNTWLPEDFGLLVDGIPLAIASPAQLKMAIAEVERAMAAGEPTASIHGQAVPARPDVVEALRSLLTEVDAPGPETPADSPAPDLPETAPSARHGLLVKDNYEDLAFRKCYTPRQAPESTRLPGTVRTTLKPHQREALDTLRLAWRQGRNGLLLADDMGLGKTLTCLTFLAWLRETRPDRQPGKAPLLVVAPTGLLRNWLDEHRQHLIDPGLGRPLEAFHAQLRNLKRPDGGLRTDAIRDADWVLTTYETMRDYHQDFAVVKFDAVVFDEMQKLKNPGSQLFRAAQTLQGEFMLGLTGTPIENRLEDLWALLDILDPGLLGDLKSFSGTHTPDNQDALRRLKQFLERRGEEEAPFMLRRMKADILEGLPVKHEHPCHEPMPPEQTSRYNELIQQRPQGKGAMLKLLQHLRLTSLHPLHPATCQDPAAYFAASARTKALFERLDAIHAKGEKALVFLESLALQPVLALQIQRRYRMERAPSLINGEALGGKRQEMVARFQKGVGFDVMILSPKAGGVGLTLTAANHVLHLSRWWNPAVEDQCTDRVYRIGQTKEVHVHYLMAVHPAPELRDYSFDLTLHALLERKRTMSRDFLMPPEREGDCQALLDAMHVRWEPV